MLCDLVNELLHLPPKNRSQNAKQLERTFFNPEKIDIFTEKEAEYNQSLLRNKYKLASAVVEDQYEELIIDELFAKSKRTIQVLSNHLMLNKAVIDDIIDPKNPSQSPKKTSTKSRASSQSPGSSIILLKKPYQNQGHRSDIQTTIKLLIRCRKLYQAMQELKHIL